MNRKVVTGLLTGFLFLTGVCALSAQSNEVIDGFLEQERATYGHCAYMVLASLGEIPDEASVEVAAETLPAEGWSLKSRPADQPISLGEYSHMLMKAFDMKGGIMYTLLPGPRYAARELRFLEFIPGNSSPGRSLDGREAVQILGRLLQWKEDRS
ncbi:MAG: hypothetical protein ACLFSA_04030 [Spirochaetaceae bacterium]